MKFQDRKLLLFLQIFVNLQKFFNEIQKAFLFCMNIVSKLWKSKVYKKIYEHFGGITNHESFLPQSHMVYNIRTDTIRQHFTNFCRF